MELCDWTPVTVPLPESWTLLLYTDGIIEARAGPEAQARIGIEGLVALLAKTPHQRAWADADLRRLTASVQRMNGGPLPDDATLLALSRVNFASRPL